MLHVVEVLENVSTLDISGSVHILAHANTAGILSNSQMSAPWSNHVVLKLEGENFTLLTNSKT